MTTPSDPSTIPEPKHHLLLKNARAQPEAPVQSLARLARELGPIYRFATPLAAFRPSTPSPAALYLLLHLRTHSQPTHPPMVQA